MWNSPDLMRTVIRGSYIMLYNRASINYKNKNIAPNNTPTVSTEYNKSSSNNSRLPSAYEKCG